MAYFVLFFTFDFKTFVSKIYKNTDRIRTEPIGGFLHQYSRFRVPPHFEVLSTMQGEGRKIYTLELRALGRLVHATCLPSSLSHLHGVVKSRSEGRCFGV